MICRSPEPSRRTLVFFDFVTHFGGAQRSTVATCRALLADCAVHVVDPYGACEPWVQAIQEAASSVEVLMPQSRSCCIGHEGRPFRRALGLLAQIPQHRRLSLRLAESLERLQPDWVLTNSPKALALLWLAGAFTRYRIVFYARGWYQRGQVSAVGRHLIRKAHGVLAVSKATAASLRAWGVAPHRIHVVHTLIEPEELDRLSREPLATRPPRLDGPCRILLPGQLVRAKGQDTALCAAGLLKQRGLDFVLWLAGDVKVGGDTGYRRDLAEQIMRLHLEDRVFLLGHRADVAALMRSADMVILPTLTEGLPRAVWEAQVLERPVIATPVGGVPDLVEDGKTGLLVAPGEGQALAEAILRLWQDAALRQRIVRAAADHIRSEFPYDGQREALRRALEQIGGVI